MSKPLAWINAITGDVTTVDCSDTILWAPLYLAPKNQESLSDDEIYNLWMARDVNNIYDLVRRVEKAHGIGER